MWKRLGTNNRRMQVVGAACRWRGVLGGHGLLVAVLVAGAILATAATACNRSAVSLQVSSLGLGAVAVTPTLPQETEEIERFLPLLIEGMWVPPTPTATPGPYDAPPAGMNQGLEVLSAKTSQRVVGDRYLLQVAGEVCNSGSERAQTIRVVFVASSRGTQCGRGALTLLGQEEAILRPGERWPFSGSLYIDCSADEVAFQVIAVQTDTTPLRLAVEGAAIGATASGDWMLSGVLRNQSSVPVAYPRAVVTLRRSDGAYVASAVAYAGVSSLAPSASAAFTVVISAADASGWAEYAVIGTGGVY